MTSVERTPSDTSTGWAATSTGRVFVSKNVDADPAAAVSWTRIDSATTPNRYLELDLRRPSRREPCLDLVQRVRREHPGDPGHVFEVTYNPVAGTATWVDRSLDWGDLPATDVVRDDVTGDVYASSDFGVLMLPAAPRAGSWLLRACRTSRSRA